MITRDIKEVAKELHNMLVIAIYDIAEKKAESFIDLSFMYQNTFYENLEIFLDEDEIQIEVYSQYTDNEDGLVYEDTNDLRDLDLSVLLKIYEIMSE